MVNRIDIEINAIGNFSQPIAQIAELRAAVAKIHSMPMLGNFGKEATMQVGAAQKAFDKAILSTRAFNMEMVKMSSHIDEFGMRMQAGQLKFGEYFKLYRQNVRGVANQLDELAASQARVAKSMVIPDALRSGYARVITNTTADLKTLGAAEEAAAIKAKLLNTTIHGMGTQLVNLGKNTQWAGRQLSMGLTMPIVAFGAAAAKTFKDVNVELTKLQRLYGKGVTPPSEAEINKISDQALKLGKDIAQTMGIAQKETVATAASFAAIGLEGNKLIDATEQAMKLSKLGALTSEDAQRTIVAMQNVFKVTAKELPDAVNFLASIQKQTSLSLQDISDAIPRVGPIIQQLGGSYKDAAVMMVAMKEAGIPAAQSANAIKSAVASMIAPTSAASEMFKKFGISLSGIKDKSGGNPIQMIEALQASMKNLEPLAKAQLIEKLFGKFQFARVTALIENLGKAGSQTQTALAVAGASTSQLATLTNQEMTKAVESVSSKWQRAVEGMKAQLQPFGEGFVKFGTKVVNVIEKILSFLNKFKPLKNLLVTVLGGAALVGPLLMVVGLMGNFVGSLVKGVAFLRMFGAGFSKGGLKTGLFELADGWKMIDKGSLAATESADMFESSVMKSTEAFSTLNFEVEKLKDKLMAIASMTANGITTKFSPVAALGQYPASQNTLEEMQQLHPYYGGGYTVKNIERPHMSPAAQTWGGWSGNVGGIQQKQPGLAAFLSDPSRFPKGLPQQEAWMKHGTSEQWGMPVPVGGLASTLQKAYSDEPVIHGPKFGTQKSDVVARGMAHIESIRARIINGDIAADSLVARELEKIDALPDDVKEKELVKVIEQVTFTEKQYFENMIETFVTTKAILVSDEEKVAALDKTMKGIMADSSIADKPAAFQAAMIAFNEDFVRFGGTLVNDVAAYRQIVTQTIMAGQTEFETAIAAAALRAGLVTEAELAGGSKLAAFGAIKSMDKHVLEQTLIMGARHAPKGYQEGGIPRFQSGVTSPWVPGSGSGDKIPAMLEPGEFVINRNAAKKYGSLLTDINYNKAPRFQTGGGLPGFESGGVIAVEELISSIMAKRGSNKSIGPKMWDPEKTSAYTTGENLFLNNMFAKSGKPEMIALRESLLRSIAASDLDKSQISRMLETIHTEGSFSSESDIKAFGNILDQTVRSGGFNNVSNDILTQALTTIEAAKIRTSPVTYKDIAPELEAQIKTGAGKRRRPYSWDKYTEETFMAGFNVDNPLSLIESGVLSRLTEMGITDPQQVERLINRYVHGKQNWGSGWTRQSFQASHLQSGGIPGFQSGVNLSAMPESWSKKYTSWTDALAASDLEARSGRFANLELTNIGSRVQDLSGMSSLIPGVNGVYEINGQKYVIKGHDTPDSALIESRGTQLTREIFGLNTPNQGFIKFAHPQTGQHMFGVMSPYDETFANSTGNFGKDNAVNQMLAAVLRRDKDLQADNFWQSIVGDVGAGFLGNKASQPRLRLDTPIVDLETQLRANLLIDKAGARRHGAEATAPIIKELGAEGLTQKWQEAAKAALAKAETALANLPMMTVEEQKAYSYIIEDLRKASTMDMAPYFDAWASVEPQIKKPPTEKALATKEANKLKASMERATALEAGYPRWAMQTGGIPGFTQGLTPLPMAGDLPSTIVYDIDKTLAGSVDFTRAAGQHTLDAWAAAAADAPVNSAELAKYNFLKSMGHKMAVVTARGEKYDPMTLAWLKKNGINFDEFISRPNGVTSSDPVFKRSVLEGMMGRAQIAGFIDDKPANLRMAAKLGIPAIEAISTMPKLQTGGMLGFETGGGYGLESLVDDWQQGPKKIRNYPDKLKELLSYLKPISKDMTLRRKTRLGVPGEMPQGQQVDIMRALETGDYESILGRRFNLTGKPSAYTEWGFDWLASKEFTDSPQKLEFAQEQLAKSEKFLETIKSSRDIILAGESEHKYFIAKRWFDDRLAAHKTRLGSLPYEEQMQKYVDMYEQSTAFERKSVASLMPYGKQPVDVMIQRLFKKGNPMLDVTQVNPDAKYRGKKMMEREWLTSAGKPKLESVSQMWMPPDKMIGGQRAYQAAIENNLFPYVLNMKQRGGIQGYQKGGGPGFAEGLTSTTGLTDFREAHIRRRSVEGTSAYHGEQHIELLYDYGNGKGVTLHLMKTEPSGYPALLDSELVGKWQVAELLNNGAPQTAAIEALTHGRELLRMQGEDLSSSAIAELGSYSDHSIGMVDRARKSGMLNMTDEQRADIGRNSYTKTLGAQKVNGLADWANNKMSDWSKTEFLPDWKNAYRTLKTIPFAAQTGAQTPWVPGSGEGDRIPAMLEPGEFVVNKNAAKQYGGLLSHLNWNAAPRFIQGSKDRRPPGQQSTYGPQSQKPSGSRELARGLEGKGEGSVVRSAILAETRATMAGLEASVISTTTAMNVLNTKGIAGSSLGLDRLKVRLTTFGDRISAFNSRGVSPLLPNTGPVSAYSPNGTGSNAKNLYPNYSVYRGAGFSPQEAKSLANQSLQGGMILPRLGPIMGGPSEPGTGMRDAFKLGRSNLVPTGNILPDGKPEMAKPRMSDVKGMRGKLSYLAGRQAQPGMGTMIGGQMAGMLGMQVAGGMQDGYAKSAMNAASMGAMLGSMTPLGPIGGAAVGAIAGGAMKAYGNWKEKLKNQADLLTDSLTMDSVAMKHLGVTARDFSNIVYNASGKILKSSSEFQQGVQDYKTSEDPLIVSALKGLANVSQSGNITKIEDLMRSRFSSQLLSTGGNAEERKKVNLDMQQFMAAGGVGALTRKTIVSDFKDIKKPQDMLYTIANNAKFEPPEQTWKKKLLDGLLVASSAGSPIENLVAAQQKAEISKASAKPAAQALYSMQTTSNPLQLGQMFDISSDKTKKWVGMVNESKDTFYNLLGQIKKADPAMAKYDFGLRKIGMSTTQIIRINNLYASGLEEIPPAQLQIIKNNPQLLGGLELQSAAQQSVNDTLSEYLANAQAHDAQMATQNSAAQKAADAAQAEQDRLNGLIDSSNKYINSEQNKINKIQKEKSAYDNLMAAQEQSIQNENTLNNLKSAVTKARAGGDLLAMANAQSNYNAELQKQADEKAKQAKDADYDKMMEKHQNNIDGAQKKIDVYNAKLKDLEKATTSAAKVASENWNTIASKATPATDAVNGINDSVYGTAMKGGWKNAQELYEKVLGEDSGMAGKLKKAGMKAADLKSAIFDFAKSASGTEMQTANAMIGNFGDLLDGIANKTKKVQVAQMLQATLTAQIASGKVNKSNIEHYKKADLAIIEAYTGTNDRNTPVKEGSLGYWNGKPIVYHNKKWYRPGQHSGQYKALEKQPKSSDFVYTNRSGTGNAYKFADGGFLRGPGGPKSDMIPAMLSNGEFVMNAEAVSKYGTGFMDMINARKFANGGPVMNDYMKSDSVHHQQIDGWKWDKKQKKYILPAIKPKSIEALNSVKSKNLTRMFDTSAMNKSIRLSGQAGAGTFNSTINDHTVYNITVNAKTGSNPQDIAKLVMDEIKKANKSLGTSRRQGARV